MSGSETAGDARRCRARRVGRRGGDMSLEGADGPVLNPGPRSFRNVVFDIAPGGEVGTFDVHARFLGVDMEHFRLHYQVRGHPRPRGRA